MKLEGLHEKEIFTGPYPFRLVENTADGFRYPMHWHNAAELVYNAAGTCCISAAGSEYSLGSGELLLIPAGEIHEIISCSKNGKRYFIQFDISSLDGFGGINDVRPFMDKIIKIGAGYSPQLRASVEKCVADLISEYEKKDYAYALSINARIFDIVVLISRSQAGSPGGRKCPEQDSNRTEADQQGIRIHREELSPANHAQGHLAGGRIQRILLFKALQGIYRSELPELPECIQGETGGKAAEIHGKDDTEIALDTGFNSVTTFNRIFRKIKGCSPSYYRKAGM